MEYEQMKMLALPKQEYLHDCFTYQDGCLYWKWRPLGHFSRPHVHAVWNAKFAGTRAGRQMVVGHYRQVGLDTVRYLEHRLIAAMHGIPTDKVIDHKDRTGNNRVENLRPATQSQNVMNGTGWRKKASRVGTHQNKNGTWVAYIKANGKHRHLGTYKTEAEAAAARIAAERIYYGEFASGDKPKPTQERA
jgi:hypothetical protein